MKNAITHLLALCLALALCVSLSPPVGAEYVPPVELLKIGLYNDGQKTYPSANLQNGTELGWGYRFGWYDKNRVFHDLDVTVTDTNKISMSVDKNLVWDAAERTYKEGTEGSVVVGCFHVQVNSAFSTAEEAMEVAVPLNGGGRNVFLRFSDGSFYVCIGSFLSREAAEAYGEELNLRDWSITSGTSRTVSVTETGTSRILFEFDYGSTASLAVRPLAEGKKAQTYFKGYLYYGDFAYIRPAAGQLTVVNYVPIEDYVKGVLPYEMDASWPLEALKAQAICARTYALRNLNKHAAEGFDICNTTDCQVYRGTSAATAHSDSAAESTAGEYLTWQDELCETYFYSHNGGASESSENVWLYAKGYLVGKTDPYEAAVVNLIERYNWSVSYTGAEIAAKLQSRGYDCGKIVKFEILEFTPSGNVLRIRFTDEKGKTFTFSKEMCRLVLGLRSQRYTIGGMQPGSSLLYVNSASGLITDALNTLYAIGAGGIAALTGQTFYAISGKGEVAELSAASSAELTGNTFLITGSGWGHNVGLSQWGAYSMAKVYGMSCEEILNFYYTGAEITKTL